METKTIEEAMREIRNIQMMPDVVAERIEQLFTSITDQSYETGYRDGGNSKENDWSNLAEEYPELLLQKVADQSKREEREKVIRVIKRLPANGSVVVGAYPTSEYNRAHNDGYKQNRDRILKYLEKE